MSDTVSNERAPALLTKPMPERIASIIMLDGKIRTLAVLSVGVHIRWYDNYNLPIVPIKEVLFAIGDEENPERTTFSVPASTAEAIRDRLNEFIMACQMPVTSREITQAVLKSET